MPVDIFMLPQSRGVYKRLKTVLLFSRASSIAIYLDSYEILLAGAP